MAHEIYEINGGHSMGYVGQTPWHGLGQKLSPDSPLEVWQKEARLDWELNRVPVSYNIPYDGQGYQKFPGRDVLVRSDNGQPLSIVSSGYNIVQPVDILEFYRTLIDSAGFKMETAGSLFNGKKIWALAKTGDIATIKNDRISSYLLLATSCDASLATTAQFTNVRAVCNNTLTMAIQRGEEGKTEYAVKVPHNKAFNPDEVKAEMGLVHDSFKLFREQATAMMERKMSNKDAVEFLVKIMGDETKNIEEQPNPRRMKRVIELFDGGAIGSAMPSADGTLWGLLNAVTQYADHDRNTRTPDNRLDTAWFGEYSRIKTKAFEECLVLAGKVGKTVKKILPPYRSKE